MEVDGSLTGIKNRHCPLVKKRKKIERKEFLIKSVFLWLLGQ